MAIHTVYGLIDPRTNNLRYVGQTRQSLACRLREHIHDSKRIKRKCAQWIKGLSKFGLKPSIVVLEETKNDHIGDAERFWIASLRAAGARLLNMTDGGDGVTWTPELRIKAANNQRGKKASKETRAKLRLARLGNKSRTGWKNSQAWAVSFKLTSKGQKRSPATKLKMSKSALAAAKRPERSRHLQALGAKFRDMPATGARRASLEKAWAAYSKKYGAK